ncbi:MAG: serine/threonine-protein kinase [Mycobacterium sp.]|uniref:serine/threonine-protein kinase n=1 Tax=Mycobacterium sp. TaxID=1785 RepID=UPI003BB60540
MPLVSGATAAGFSIVRPLEYEEFGELYVAKHPTLPRLQVLQLIPADVSTDLDYRERFTQESDLAAALWHPNILGITDRGEFEGQLWLSRDYVDGADTATLLGDQHPDGLPPKMVVEIVSAVADALDYAHDHGVLHQFVNPGNILVSKSPSDIRRVTLAGFGVAHPLGDTNTLTRANLFIGTASFTAPEQLVEDVVDGRADQYALAGSAFHLLTGSPPFAHFNPAVTASKHLNDRPPRPSEVRPDLTDYDAIFARALSQDPVDRFRRCRDFAKALESTAGTRSHIRGAAIFRDAPDRQDTATTALLAAPESDNAAPTKPAAHAAPDTARHDAPAAPVVLPDSDVDEATPSVDPVVSGAAHDDAADDEARRRRLQHTAALAGVILVVVLAWFFGVKALRSASRSDDTPTGVDTTSAESTTPLPAATAPPAMIAPPPPPPAPPAPSHPVATAVTTPPTITPSPAVTTRPPTSSSTPQTTVPQTTKPRSTSPTATPSGLDTRPAVGMPCSPDQTGAAAISNSGGPVSCVDTPGGSAWEPPGG